MMLTVPASRDDPEPHPPAPAPAALNESGPKLPLTAHFAKFCVGLAAIVLLLLCVRVSLLQWRVSALR
jgi:hypothetical protein